MWCGGCTRESADRVKQKAIHGVGDWIRGWWKVDGRRGEGWDERVGAGEKQSLYTIIHTTTYTTYTEPY